MSEHANTREKRLAALAVAVVVLVTVLLIVETFRLLLPGLWSAFSAGDEQALSAYLTSQGRLRSFLTLWFLAVVQVLSLVIPAMPVQLAAGPCLWAVARLCDELFRLGRCQPHRLSRRAAAGTGHPPPDCRQCQGHQAAEQRAQQQRPVVYTILAFITPGLPNGIIPYAAANAGMRPKHFIAAIFISLPFPTLLTCAAGSFILEGNWFFTVLTGIVLFSFVGILFFNRTRLIAGRTNSTITARKKPGHESLGFFFFIKVSPKGEGHRPLQRVTQTPSAPAPYTAPCLRRCSTMYSSSTNADLPPLRRQ